MNKSQNLQNFDYILAGGGMAGLSLAYYLNDSSLSSKSILIIDRELKNKNDHTYCFWEREESVFEKIVYKKWNKVWFHGKDNFSKLLDLENFTYKMIRGIDFYEFVISSLKQNNNITFLNAEIEGIKEVGSCTIVKTNQGDYFANDFVFDSFHRLKYNNPSQNNLLQHFTGWLIETPQAYFNPETPTLFDFGIDQKNECRFVYVLPFSENCALIEFTIFSKNLANLAEYESNLKHYITNNLGIAEYKIVETEHGIIPMSDQKHEARPMLNVIRIGTSGGYVKASTGYSFYRTQKYLQNMVKSLESNDLNVRPINNRWKRFLDSVLLNVMKNQRMEQDKIFSNLFSKNKPTQVLSFLNEETSLWEDIKLMNSVPKWPFMKAAAEELFKRIAH